MKRLATLFSLLAFTTLAAAQQQWNITDVRKKTGELVGHIYHTSSVGTQVGAKTEKFVTGIRLVCTTKRYLAMGNPDPIIAIYWNTMAGENTETVFIEIDGKSVSDPLNWYQDGQILFRNLSDSHNLIQAMKSGKTMKVYWTSSDAVRRSSVFDIRTFNAKIAEFNTSCNTKL